MWPFTSRSANLDDVRELKTDLRSIKNALVTITNHLERMAEFMARTFEEVLADLDTLTTDAADRISAQNALIAELQSAVAAGDSRTAEALSAQLTQHVAAMEEVATRLRAIATDPDDVVPDPSPLPEVPVDQPVDEEPETPSEPEAPVDEEPAPAEDETPVAEEPAGEDTPADDDGFAQDRRF